MYLTAFHDLQKIKSYLNLILLEMDLVKSIKKLLKRKSRKGRINVLID